MIRVLHVLSGMGRGGIETWIMNVFRRLDAARITFDFAVEATEERDYDEEIRQLGGRILRMPAFRHRGRFGLAFCRALRDAGPFHVVHVHGRHNAALPIGLARAFGIPVRIGQVHNVKDSHNEDLVRRTYKRAMKRLLLANATWLLGCSTNAVESLYGDGCVGRHSRVEVLPYGIDLNRFVPTDVGRELRRDLGISAHSKVCGHVGRFVWEKNHLFLLEVFAELIGRDPDWVLMLVGDGRLRPDLEAKARALGVYEQVRFVGIRADVPQLMSAMDVMVFPSLLEGFGLVMVEAQAVGLPCVVSENIPSEVTVNPALIARCHLSDGARSWAEAIVQAYAKPRESQRSHEMVRNSQFAVERSLDTLLTRYYGVSQVAHSDGDLSGSGKAHGER